MTNDEFVQKWSTPEVVCTTWGGNPSTVYWARSYRISTGDLVEMSKDYMSTPYSSVCSSSKQKAKEVLKDAADGSIWSAKYDCL